MTLRKKTNVNSVRYVSKADSLQREKIPEETKSSKL